MIPPDPARWERIRALFERASDMPEHRRAAFLERACGDDASLAEEVLGLLEEDAREDLLLDRDPVSLAGSLLGGGGVPPGAASAPGSGRSEGSGVVGLRFGPYRPTEVIGEGGMGIVYLAEHETLGHRAAVKVLRDAVLSPARRERFAAEQRVLARLEHPSIARLYEADVLPDGTPWFAMEFVEGVPITDYCRRRRSSLEGRLLLLRAACEAVREAHRHLIVHRDLKPSNILVRRDGVVKLLDFGIAKELEEADVPVEQTRAGRRLMTPAYAAPEQLRGEPVGVHTDVYALGVVLYRLLAGRLPREPAGRAPTGAGRPFREGEPPKPSGVARQRRDRRDVPVPETAERKVDGDPVPSADRASWADLDVLCLAAMHPDPDRRYPTVDALVRDIDHFLAGEPLEARPDSLGYRAGKFARRHRRRLVAAGLVAALGAGLVGFYSAQVASARSRAAAEAARTERIQRFMLDLFRGGDAVAGPAETLRVVSLLDRGVREARSLEAEPAVQAELLHTLGGLYREMGRLERADSLLGSALDLRRSLHGPEHPDVAESQVELGLLRLAQARHGEAERLVAGGLERLEADLPADHPALLRAATSLGKVLEETGEYARAVGVLEEAVRRYGGERAASSGAGDPDLTAALNHLGNTHFYAGDLAAADSLFRRVLEMDRRIYGGRHPVVAGDLINVGAVRHERGAYDEAVRLQREALAITEAFHGTEDPRTASSLTVLGRSLLFAGELEEAKAALLRALAVQEGLFGEDHPVVASTVNELGNVALLQDRPEEAEAAFRRVVRIYRTVHAGDHFTVGVAVSNLGSVHLNAGDYREAERHFREAVRIFSATQGPDGLNAGIARIKLGRALLRQGRWEEAVRESGTGHEIVVTRSDGATGWLRSALADLAEAHDSLGRRGLAERYYAELAALDSVPSASASR